MYLMVWGKIIFCDHEIMVKTSGSQLNTKHDRLLYVFHRRGPRLYLLLYYYVLYFCKKLKKKKKTHPYYVILILISLL